MLFCIFHWLTELLNCVKVHSVCSGGSLPLLICGMQIRDAINKYIVSCESEGIGEKTIEDKQRHLGLFCSTINKEIENITLEDIYNFVNNTPFSDIRKWRIKIDLRAFFRFLNEHHYSNLTYTLIKNKEPELGIRPSVTEEEFKLMDKYLHTVKDNNEIYLKWHTIFHFLYETGVRRSELCNIKEWDNENKTFFVVTAKTYKKRQGFYLTDLSPYLNRFKPKKVLFSISKREVSEMIHRIVKRSGVTRNISPHSFRHAFCTRLLTNGCPIQQTALLAGHQKVSTTMRYYHESNLKNAYESFINAPKTIEIRSSVGIKTKYSVKLQITKNK